MQRAHLTVLLASTAALAAWLAPGLPFGGPAAHTSGPLDPIQPPVHGAQDPIIDLDPQTSLNDCVESVDVTVRLDQSTWVEGDRSDHYAVVETKASDRCSTAHGRRPVDLALVVDVSGSMAGAGKIDQARRAVQELTSALGPQDTFSVVAFSDRANVVLPRSAMSNFANVERLTSQLRPAGGTNLSDGLETGLRVLAQGEPDALRRVVILSDGNANLGVTDAGALERIAGTYVSQGITVSTIGLGLDFDDDLLAAMGDAGGGHYQYVSQNEALGDLFKGELDALGNVAFRQSTLRVQSSPGLRIQAVLGGGTLGPDGTVSLALGDLRSGEVRRTVVVVQGDGRTRGATLRADFAGRSVGDGSEAQANAAVHDDLTANVAEAQKSFDAKVGTMATRAIVGASMGDVASSAGGGDFEAAKTKKADTMLRLEALARRAPAAAGPTLEAASKDLDRVDALLDAPSAAPDRAALLELKEEGRAYTR